MKYILLKDKQVVKSNGHNKPFKTKGKKANLNELQKAVGGYIQIIRLSGGFIMVLDEDGKSKGKQVNKEATKLARLTNDVIVGDVVVLKEELVE